MLFSTILFGLLATLTTAQYPVGQLVLGIPKCGLTCLEAAIPKVCGSKGLLDYECQCGHQAQIAALATPCIKSTCEPQQQLDILAQTLQICQVVKAVDVASSNSAASKTMTGSQTMSSPSSTTAIPFGQSGYALTSGPTSYKPTGNAAWARATAAPLVGAGMAALAFAL